MTGRSEKETQFLKCLLDRVPSFAACALTTKKEINLANDFHLCKVEVEGRRRRRVASVVETEEEMKDAARNHFSHSVSTRETNYTTFIIAGKMLHQCLFLTMLWLNHVWGTPYYYADERPEEPENDQSHYEFRYGVRDHGTGDVKNQWEVRKGDKVKGEYSLLEPDGTVRTVQYSADNRHGFNAIVTREGKSKHPAPKHQKTYHPTENEYSKKPIIYFPQYLDEEVEFDPKHLTDYESNFYSPEEDEFYEVTESKRKAFFTKPDVPPNHSPVYTGVSDYGKLLTMYKNFREQNSITKKHKFDYGINEYFENGYEALSQQNKNMKHDFKQNPYLRGVLRRILL